MAISLKEQITSDLKESLKSGDNLKRDVLRLLFGAIKNVEIEKKKKEEGLNGNSNLHYYFTLALFRLYFNFYIICSTFIFIKNIKVITIKADYSECFIF